MNILWLTNISLPEASKLMSETPLPIGGWLVNTSYILSNESDVKLSITFPKQGVQDIKTLKGNKINYYAISPIIENDLLNNDYESQLNNVLKMVEPDIVHIFGTEIPHTLAMVTICKRNNIKTIISIQGLVSVYEKHYYAQLPEHIINRFTFRDFIKQDNLKQQKKKMAYRGKFEIEALKEAEHVIGRTTWDKACTKQVNSNLQYHFCNETLREEFYKHIWSLDGCERHSIFISQATYPIKGLHILLDAMPLILERFPDTKIYISGHDITKSDTLREKLKQTSYAKYLKELIEKYNLKDHIVFTGSLDEKKMCERYLKSHVFVCPSSIENSPNSLGEAMLLGVPCVASNVGGVMDMMKHNEEGFVYPFGNIVLLAEYICELFNNDALANKFSEKARIHASETHHREKNLHQLMNIYKEIV